MIITQKWLDSTRAKETKRGEFFGVIQANPKPQSAMYKLHALRKQLQRAKYSMARQHYHKKTNIHLK